MVIGKDVTQREDDEANKTSVIFTLDLAERIPFFRQGAPLSEVEVAEATFPFLVFFALPTKPPKRRHFLPKR